ncbi:hypothetical protein K469DRAFT_589671 [Zopfia rhizophila CBS 207.26]|uniref:Uncharacterized protein n=1 Tax=Zopfia rhizophila CBS 207.26 TaxID=1314779 RepID=A0A6A6DQC6_9PEZI|nr:hypothetical protein K469DRAFT_589671 [Zopfia rhizophila CBS 207.26]
MINKKNIIEKGWGNRANFQASYGLKMTPDDLEEGDAILEAMQRQDRDAGNP